MLRDDRAFASLAVAASLVLHLLLVWFVLQQTVRAPRVARDINVILVRQKPPPPPPPQPVQAAKHVAVSPPPVPRSMHRAAPAVMVHTKPQIRAQLRSPVRRLTTQQTRPGPPVMHFGASGAQAGLGLELGLPSGGGGNGHNSIGDFDDAVKQRIQAAKTYPPGIPGTWNECVVEYRVTIDRNGQMLDYKLYGCGDPFLDSAARAAILLAAPFPLPPDYGGNQYTVFGSLVFKHR